MANIFLDPNEIYPIGASADVFGRSEGTEGVSILAGASDVTLDANIERIDLPAASSEVTFEVTGAGLTASTGDTTLVTISSLNQDTQVRLTDGSVMVRQTGATAFEVEGADGTTQPIGMQSTSVNVPLGDAESGTGSDDEPSDSGPTAISASNTGPFDAATGDVTYDIASGDYTATINGLNTGDVLDPFDGAAVSLADDSDQSDGEQTVTFTDTDTATTATLTLTGLSGSEDANLESPGDFDAVFGEDTLLEGSSTDGGSAASVGLTGTDDADLL